jgi:TatD DNase family protein
MSHDKNSNSATSILTALTYVDAHLHLADPGYADKVEEVVDDAAQHNVSRMLSNAVDHESSLATIRLAKQFPSRVLAAVGVHPFTVTRPGALNLDKFSRMIDDNSGWISAIGEIGLDGKYAQDERVRARQRETFRFFLGLAEEKNLPVVVHSRGAVTEALASLADFRLPHVLLHWYDGPIENLSVLREREYLISIGPAALYSRKIAKIARAVDPGLILSETDGPVKYRGLFGDRVARPSFVVEVVKKLAELRGMNPEDTQSTISSNFERFLGAPNDSQSLC